MNLAEQLRACEQDLRETYASFGIKKDPRWDDHALGRLIQLHGLEKTRAALIGARHETGTESFRPKDHFSLQRLARPDVFEKCVNLGLQRRGSAVVRIEDAREGITTEAPITESERAEIEAAKAKVLSGGWLRAMPEAVGE